MTPTLTATPEPATGAVDLTVTGALGAITVTRYVQGVSPTGQNVRGTFANGRTVPDRDAPLNTDLVYIANDSGDGQSAQVAARLESVEAILNVMSDPSLSAAVTVLADTGQAYAGRSTAHAILGTNAVIATIDKPAFRRGTYRLLFRTHDEWLVLRDIIATGAVMLLRSPCPAEFADTSFIMVDGRTDIRWNSAAPRQRIVEIDYQATTPDTNPPREYAWTWADVPATYATWADVPLAVPTWGDLASHVPDPAAKSAQPGIGF